MYVKLNLRLSLFKKTLIWLTDPIKKSAEHRIPILKEACYEPLINAPDTFTPDGKWVIGETPEVWY